jgi:hypothetical protein
VEKDCNDPNLTAPYPAISAADILHSPDSTLSGALMDVIFPTSASARLTRCLRLGLIPFGAWAAVAAGSVHSPRQAPETRCMLMAIADTKTRGEIASLGPLLRVLRTNARELAHLDAPVDGATIFPPLLAALSGINDSGGGAAWAGTIAACDCSISLWKNQKATSADALRGVLSSLDGFCRRTTPVPGAAIPAAGSPTTSESPSKISDLSEGSAITRAFRSAFGPTIHTEVRAAVSEAFGEHRAAVASVAASPDKPTAGARRAQGDQPPVVAPRPVGRARSRQPRGVSVEGPNGHVRTWGESANHGRARVTSTRPRVSHGPLIRDVATLHRRTGVTNH